MEKTGGKRFYWIKLKTDFFTLDEIDFLLSQKNGCEYVVLYQMLCLMTANNGGSLCTRIGEMIIPFDIEKIIRETKYFDFDTVTIALELFKKLGLIYEQEDGILHISALPDMVGSETGSAKRVREHRAKKALHCNVGVTPDVTQEIRDKSIEYRDIDNRDIDIREREKKPRKKSAEISRHKYGEYQNVLLSDSDLEKLQAEFPDDWRERIERLSAYMASTGKSYKNHLATIRNWAKKDAERAATQQPASRPTGQAGNTGTNPFLKIAQDEGLF